MTPTTRWPVLVGFERRSQALNHHPGQRVPTLPRQIQHQRTGGMPHRTEPAGGVEGARPEWFAAFLADRGTRKPSAHTLKAYRQDFDAIATLIAGGEDLSAMALGAITIETLRTAFARYAQTHEAASIQRCWSTWNVLCTYLFFTAELIAANPMPMVGRPKHAKTLPKALPADAVAALLGALSADPPPRRRTDCMQRDRALILTALLAGLRADELVRANVGDLRRTDDGAVIHVRGKGGKDRRVPIEPTLVDVLERYLDTTVRPAVIDTAEWCVSLARRLRPHRRSRRCSPQPAARTREPPWSAEDLVGEIQ
jgi:site-specific recombinase XerC